MTRFSINSFVNPNGAPVFQVFCNALPITRELADEATARHCAFDAFARHTSAATVETWNADDGYVEIARNARR